MSVMERELIKLFVRLISKDTFDESITYPHGVRNASYLNEKVVS